MKSFHTIFTYWAIWMSPACDPTGQECIGISSRLRIA